MNYTLTYRQIQACAFRKHTKIEHYDNEIAHDGSFSGYWGLLPK